jgi:hypothetical protein
MADKKMTKAEMAAQMGITPEQLAAKEAENKARIAAANTPAVKPAETPPPKASTEEPTAMDRLKGTLKAAYNVAADTATATVQLVTDLARDPGGTIRKVGTENTAAGEAVNRANTSDSEQNRRWQRQEREAGM